MTIRNYGAFDDAFSGVIAGSRRSNIVKTFAIHGLNPDVDATAEEDIWDLGGVYDYLSAPTVLTCQSTSAEDNPAGTGIGYVKIRGLDANWDLVEETVELNGLTPVSTVIAYIRVLRIAGSKPGAADPNVRAVGQITVQDGTNIQAAILAANTVSNSSLFSVPRNYSGFFTLYYASGRANDDYKVKFGYRERGDIFTFGPDLPIHGQQYPVINYIPPIGYAEERSDIKFMAQANVLDARPSVGYTLILVRNDYLDSVLESI